MLIVTTQATGAEPQTDRAPLPGKIGDAAQIAAMKPRRSSPTCWTTRRRPTCPEGDGDLFCAITHFFDKELRRYEGQNALGHGSTKLPDNGASLNRRDSLFVSRRTSMARARRGDHVLVGGRDEQETWRKLHEWNRPIHRVGGRIKKIFGTWKRCYGLG